MMDCEGVDEFGREHFVVEAAPGRLGISMGENEHGFVVVREFDTLTPAELESWSQADRNRMRVMHQTVQVGDRLVAIEDEDVVHCSLREIISRLGKLAAKRRLLTFARYHVTHYDVKKYDIEKLVHTCVPKGPLGVLISEAISYGAFIDSFKSLPDGSMSRLANDPKIHRGCQIIRVNDIDTSKMPRDEVCTLLTTLADQTKEIIVYRTTPPNCSSLEHVEYSSSSIPLGLNFDESEISKCVVASVTTPMVQTASMRVGDILIGVNNIDISFMNRQDAMATIDAAPFPRTLYFARLDPIDLPECHHISLESGLFGLDLDSQQTHHARITGFTTRADADRPMFKSCANFLPGSFIISINKLDVSQHTLVEISGLLLKLKGTRKDIIVCNSVLLQILKSRRTIEFIRVPPGPLGVNFNAEYPNVAKISGFYPSPDGHRGVIERSGRIPIGSTLTTINKMNVSCLDLAQVTEILRKLSTSPKELGFHLHNHARDDNTRVVHVHLLPGALGIDLKSSISNKVIVDRLNQDRSVGATRIFDHGGVIAGSELLAIDGFNVATLELDELTQLLKLLASHDKIITFSTTDAAYMHMLSTVRKPELRSVEVIRSPIGIEFESINLRQAVISGYPSPMSNDDIVQREIPIGSRLIAIDQVDVRTLSLEDIVNILKDFAGTRTTLIFDTTHGKKFNATPTVSPVSSSLAQEIPKDVAQESPGQTALATQSQASFSPSKLDDSATHIIAEVSHSRSPEKAASRPPASPIPNSPPFSSQLAPLSIRPTEALKPSFALDTDKLSETKASASATTPTKNEYIINMPSWIGSRALYRMVIDKSSASIQITSAKPSSPRSGKTTATTIAFSEISALEFGKSSTTGSPTKHFFRSSSPAQVNNEIVIRTTSKKNYEVEMRSSTERDAFYAMMVDLIPALKMIDRHSG